MTEQTIAQLAHDINKIFRGAKPKKSEAQSTLESIYEKADLTQEQKTELARLYNYFMPAIPKKPKSDEQWVQKAAANKDVRKQINFVYADPKGYLVATDGHRMHWIDLPAMYEHGYYCPKTLNKIHDVDEMQYPDWQRVAARYGGDAFEKSVPVAEFNLDKIGKIFVYRLPNGTAYAKNYIDDALSASSGMKYMYQEDKDSPIVFFNENGSAKAMVMPILG